MESINTELDRLEKMYLEGLQGNGVTTFDTRATVKDAHTVVLADGKEISAETILVATGGRPYIPAIKGAEYVISSNEVFLWKELPRRILIVGGGYIACEFAGIFNGMGAEVTQFYRGAQILRGFDGEVRGHVAEEMIRKGVNLHVGTDVSLIEKKDDGLHITCTDGSNHIVDAVLYATGRIANTDNMGLRSEERRVGEECRSRWSPYP